jgi:hypothetical protein
MWKNTGNVVTICKCGDAGSGCDGTMMCGGRCVMLAVV